MRPGAGWGCARSMTAAPCAAGVGRGRRLWRGPAGLAAIALALTYVRSAWVGLGVAVVVLAGLTRRWALLLLLLAATVIALVASASLQTRLLSIADRTDPSATERMYFWGAGWRMIRDAPLLGLGPGGVKRHY